MSLDWACPLKKLDDETWDPYENAESTEPRARHLANLHLTFDYLYVLGGRFCSPYNIWRYNLLTREWKLLEVNGKILNAVHIDCRRACASQNISQHPEFLFFDDDDYKPILISPYQLKTTINEEFNNSEDFHWQEMSLQDTDGSLRDFDSPELNVHYFDSEHIYITNDGFEDGIFKIYQIKWSSITEKWEWTCIGGHDTADKDVQNVFQLFSMKYFNTFIHGNFLYILAFVLPEFEPDREIENLDEIEAVKHYMVRFDLWTHTFCVLNLLPDSLHGFPLKQYGQMNFMADGDFYLIGGLEWNIFTKDYSQRFKPMNEIWRLDLVKYQWTRISLAMKYPVVNSACKYNYFDGCIYTFGGLILNPEGRLINSSAEFKLHNKVQRFRLAVPTLRQVAIEQLGKIVTPYLKSKEQSVELLLSEPIELAKYVKKIYSTFS